MKLDKSVAIGVAVLCALVLAVPSLYAAEEGKKGVRIGTLVINTLPDTRQNLLIRSSVDVEATFKGEDGATEMYVGEMGIGLGVDLSIKKGETIGYVVFSPSSDYEVGSYAIAGKYYGADASAAFGAGVTGKVLLGGSKKSFTLQPLMLGGHEGLGASAGLGYLYLQKKE
jgi:hypothetical protein